MAEAGWKERVKKRYAELKELGKPFFPYIVFKDTVAVFALFMVLLVLAIKLGAGLEEIADPTDTTYNPRPEWYFLFLFQALKLFPGWMEALAAIILPSLVLLLLIVLPFLDRHPRRHPFDRPIATSLGVVAILIVVVLTIQGMRSPLLNPVVEKDPQVAAGQHLYTELRCAYCHSIQGRGGVLGPDLTTIGAKRDREWLIVHFQNPQNIVPGSKMPKLNLLPEEAEALAAYLGTLGGEGPFTPEAPKLFAEHCASCHMLDGQGGDMGPDLTAVRSYRDKAFIYTYITDPSGSNADAAMPGFKGTITDLEIEDLARYLSSAKRSEK